jgi:hypothetical protein
MAVAAPVPTVSGSKEAWGWVAEHRSDDSLMLVEVPPRVDGAVRGCPLRVGGSLDASLRATRTPPRVDGADGVGRILVVRSRARADGLPNASYRYYPPGDARIAREISREPGVHPKPAGLRLRPEYQNVRDVRVWELKMCSRLPLG